MAEPTKAPAKKAVAKKAAAPTKPKYEHAEYIDKAPSEVHQGFTEYIAATTGHTVPSGDVALVLRLYPLYLKSPDVVAARDLDKAERDRLKAIKETERKARLQAKLDKIEESRAKLLAELGLDDATFDEPEEIAPEEEPEPIDLAAVKREKARRLAAAAKEPEIESAEDPDDETTDDDSAPWEGDDEFEDAGEEVTEPVTLAPEADDESLWDEPADDEEDF